MNATNYTPVQMTSEQKFWLAIFKTGAAVVITTVLAIVVGISYFNYQKAGLLASGKSPLEIACAFR